MPRLQKILEDNGFILENGTYQGTAALTLKDAGFENADEAMLGYASAMNAIEQEMKSAGEEAWVYQTVLNALTNQYSDLSEEQKKNAETLETGKEALIAYLLAEAK